MSRVLVSSALLLLLTACDGGSEPPPVDESAFKALRQRAFQLHERGGDLGATRDALLEVYALRPDGHGVNVRLGEVYSDLKMHQEAVRHFEAALEAEPDDVDTILAIVALETRLGRHDRALELIPRLKVVPGMRGEALYREALICDHQGRRDEAFAIVADVNPQDPSRAYRALSLHGRFLLERGDFETARTRFEAAMRGRPDYKEAIKGLADCSRRLGDEEAAAHWDEVLGLLLDLTDDAYIRQQHELRIARLERLTEIHSQWTAAFQELAELYMKAGDTTRACAAIERFIEAQGIRIMAAQIRGLRKRFCGAAG